MIPAFEENNDYLSPGRHESDLTEIKDRFVDQFPKSKSRVSRFKGFVEYNQKVCTNMKCTRREIIGGSFTTKKLDPHDVDFLIILNNKDITLEEKKWIKKEIVNNYSDKKIREAMIEMLQAGAVDINLLPCCDKFFLCHRPPEDKKYKKYLDSKNYWIGKFGKSKEDKKGNRIKRGVIDLKVDSNTFEGV